eukprot:Skav209265  [mRNA]  locus=scaffold1552:97664:98741:- [translate_table: standard]
MDLSIGNGGRCNARHLEFSAALGWTDSARPALLGSSPWFLGVIEASAGDLHWRGQVALGRAGASGRLTF